MAWLFRYTMYATDKELVEGMIKQGCLSPGARDMSLSECLHQYREANAFTGRELREQWNYPQVMAPN